MHIFKLILNKVFYPWVMKDVFRTWILPIQIDLKCESALGPLGVFTLTQKLH